MSNIGTRNETMQEGFRSPLCWPIHFKCAWLSTQLHPPHQILSPLSCSEKPPSLNTMRVKQKEYASIVYKTTLTETVLLKTSFLFIFVGFVSQQIYRQYFTVQNPFGTDKNRRIRIPRTYGAFNFSPFSFLFFYSFSLLYIFISFVLV